MHRRPGVTVLAGAFASFCFGALGAYAYPPQQWLVVLPFSIAYYFFPLVRFRLHALFWGLGFFSFGIGWVYYPMHTFVGMSLAASYATSGLLVLVLAIIATLPWMAAGRFANRYSVIIAGAGMWFLAELIRSTLLGGFPWLLVGDTLTGTLLDGLHPLVGSLGSGFFFILITLLAITLLQQKQYHRTAYVLIAYLLATTIIGRLEFTQERVDPTKRVALVPLTVPQSEKFDPDHYRSVMTNLQATATHALRDPSVVLVIFPETAVPFSEKNGKKVIARLQSSVPPSGTILTGIFLNHQDGYSNGLIGISEGSIFRYHKRKLVLFGEYWPDFPFIRFIAKKLSIPFSSLRAGPNNQESLAVGGALFNTSICFEIAYPELYIGQEHQFQAMINVANEGWFGDTPAAKQQMNIAQSRAREFAKPVYRVSNWGPSGVIDSRGTMISPTTQEEPTLMLYPLTVATGLTPYNIYGNYPLLFIILSGGMYLLYVATRRRISTRKY